MYTPIQSNKVYEQIAEQIERSILSGELRSGDRLPTERELSEQFHASRTAVREAMKTLAQKGLVELLNLLHVPSNAHVYLHYRNEILLKILKIRLQQL